MPAESLKRLEGMNDEQLSQTLNFMLGNGCEEAAEEFKRKLDRMVEAREIETRAEASPPRKALPKPKKAAPALKRPEAEQEMAQEPIETVEAVAEPEPEKVVSLSSWPRPGRGFVARNNGNSFDILRGT